MRKLLAVFLAAIILCTASCAPKSNGGASSLIAGGEYSSKTDGGESSSYDGDGDKNNLSSNKTNSAQDSSDKVSSKTENSSSDKTSVGASSQSVSSKTQSTASNNTSSKEEYKGKATGKVVPKGCTYKSADGKTYPEGARMPDVKDGDVFSDGYYDYKYNYVADPIATEEIWLQLKAFSKGWGVYVKDTTQVSYPEMYSSVNERAVTNLYNTFMFCGKLVDAPKLSVNAVNMNFTFMACESLKTAPEIPEGVTEMNSTFITCKSLLAAPKLPSKVKIARSTFSGCTALKSAVNIPASATDIESIFENCENLSGEIEMNSDASFYSNALSGTKNKITLTGNGGKLFEVAMTSKSGNIEVKPELEE